MNEESKVFEKDIKILEEKIQDKVICQKVYNAVRTPLPENSNFRGMCFSFYPNSQYTRY